MIANDPNATFRKVDPAEPIDPRRADCLEVVRARARAAGELFRKDKPSSAQSGYIVVWMGLFEAANQLRQAAERNPSVAELLSTADELDRLAEHTVTLAEADTERRTR